MRPGIANDPLSTFDEGLRRSLGRITRSSVSDSNRKLVNCLLKRNLPSLFTLVKPLPGEEETRGIVRNLLSKSESISLDLMTFLY